MIIGIVSELFDLSCNRDLKSPLDNGLPLDKDKIKINDNISTLLTFLLGNGYKYNGIILS